jgi:hypothetical protein
MTLQANKLLGTNLFIDDYLVKESRGLTRTTHRPEKLPEPFLRREESWHDGPLWFMKVVRDVETDLFRAWYNVMNSPGESLKYRYAYVESKDGIEWERPNLGLVKAGGSTRNNLFVGPALGWKGCVGLFLADDGPGCADRSRRFKLGCFRPETPGGIPPAGLCVAFSPDGLRFTEHPGNPVIPFKRKDVQDSRRVQPEEPDYEYTIGDIIDGCWDPLKREYLLGCKIKQGGYSGKPHYYAEGRRRCVGMSTSKDFVTWTMPRLIVTPDPRNGLEEFYGFKPMVRGDLYIGFLRVLRDDLPADQGGPVEGIGWTELMTSRDGREWTRYQEPFIDREPKPGTWDHAMAWFADCITIGEKEYVYYGGYSAGHKVGDRGVGLGFLRKNGFVSRDAGENEGILHTPLVQLGGGTISVNAAVRDELRLRITDDDGGAVSGFDWADCAPIRGDSVAHTVRWTGDPARLTAASVRLEFRLRKGELYGFDVTER